MNILEVAENKCTGCGGCKSICLTDAIEMCPNDEGFLFPKIDESRCIGCSKCYEKCPAINDRNPDCGENSAKPRLYSLFAKEEIRSKSSAGGMFTLLSNEILSRGGYVCGVAFNGNFQLYHRLASTKEEALKFCGSKYLQSDTGLIYREIETRLKTGKPLLFTGCPCQVAALYSFLGQDYNNLFTADLLCHGVPSQQLFNKYLEEINEGRKISDIQFRDKKYGWTSFNICVSYSDGGMYEGNVKNDPFEKAFHPNLILRKACSDCKFSSFPRYGDITMGDFWGILKFDSENKDNKELSLGTSLVLVNSPKGNALFEGIKNEAQYIKELAFEPQKIGNRLSPSFSPHKSRTRFFELTKANSFKRAVDLSIDDHYDVGLAGIYSIENFGGAMTYFALYKVLEDMGLSTLMIERPKSAKSPANPLYLSFEQSPYPDYALAPIYKSKSEMAMLNDRCDVFVTGSDQLFNCYLYELFGRWITLDWVKDNKKKIAYSASFGHDRFWGKEEIRAEMSYFMKKFDAFSVREKSGVELASKDFGVDADWVVDPVFLCDKKHYTALAQRVGGEASPPYIGGYILDIDSEKGKIIRAVTEHFSIPARLYSEVYCSDEQAKKDFGLPILQGKFERRLKNIMDCEFFVTDSFHGLCFAIIFQKQFIAILNKKRGEARMTSLLSLLGLSDRLFEGGALAPRLFEKIDYRAVYKILDSERERCKAWLYDAVTSNKKKPYSDYDILKAMINSQNNMIKTLTEQNKRLGSELEILLKRLSLGFVGETGIVKYLKALAKQKAEYLIIISAKDTPGHYLNGEIADCIKSFGLASDLQSKHWHSFIGIIDRGNPLFEALAKQEVSHFAGEVCGVKLEVSSKPLNQGNEAKIAINDANYSPNKRGINIVVYDIERGIAVDSRCFDTHSVGLECYK